MDNVDKDGMTTMRKLIKAAPKVAEVVLDKCITKSKHPSSHAEYSITYDFRYIDQDIDKDAKKDGSKDNDKDSTNSLDESQYFEAVAMAKYNRESLLCHPLTKKLMAYKWSRLGRFIYYTTLAFYLVFLVCVTSVVVVDREE